MDDAALTLTLCRLLGRVPGWEFREDGTNYPADVVGIFYGATQPNPDRAIGVRVYDGDGDDAGPKTRRVQFRVRGAKNDRISADRIADVLLAVLHGLSRVGGINDARRRSWTPLGADTSAREERTENYSITIDNPEASQ